MLRFLGLCLAIGVATPLLAQRPGGFGGGGVSTAMLVGQKSVQEEVKLTDDQVAKAKKVNEDIRAKYADDLKNSFKDREKAAELRKKMSEETNKALAEVLKPDQLKRIRQIEIQLGGLNSLSRDDVAKELKLTDKQKDDLKGRVDDLRKDTGEIFKDAGKDKFAEASVKARTLSQEAATKFVSTLSDDQKTAYKEMTGKKFDGKIEFGMGGRPRPNKGDKEEE
jgi:hypothetical protein